jgi:transcriptional regulator with XRE-family HTH domain
MAKRHNAPRSPSRRKLNRERRKSKKFTFDQIPRHLASLVRGLYARVARQLDLDPSYISRVARGKRQSKSVDRALKRELRKVGEEIVRLHEELGHKKVDGRTARRKSKKENLKAKLR